MFAAATVAVLLLFGATSADAAKKIVKRGTPVISDSPQNVNRSVSKSNACGIDLMLIADGSGGIANETFEKEKQFFLTILDGLNMGPDATRVGIMRYSVWGYLQTDQFTSSKSDAKKVTKDMFFGGGATDTVEALETARDFFRDHARSENLGIPRVAVLIGSGCCEPDDVKAAKKLKDKGVTLFTVGVVGVGSQVSNDAHLRDMASEPKDQHFYKYDNNPDLAKSFPSILLGTCHASVAVPERARKT